VGNKSIFFRSMGVPVALMLTASAVVAALVSGFASPALANAQPTPVEKSYYVKTTNTSTMQTLGCDEANTDMSDGRASKVILDFGGQDGNGNMKLTNGTYISDGTAAYTAEWFAYGYALCLQNGGGTENMQLGLGTNTSFAVTSSTGTDFGNNVVAPFYNYVISGAPGVEAQAADDIETTSPQWAGPSAATAWVNAYSSVAPGSGAAIMTDYGAAEGCPPAGSCNGGWTQSELFYVAWGCSICYIAPEIYYNVPPGSPINAEQWNAINNAGGGGMFPDGPLDQWPLANSSNTATQAWSQLNAYFGAMNHSMEISNTN
jgi:hypothetical protein